MIDDLHPTAPTPGEHETTAAISDRLNQSANLRIKKQFSDRDRHRFLDEGLEYIARYFEDALKELEVRNPQVDTRFKLFDANRFEAMVYVNPEEQSRCGIWLGALSRTDSLLFSYDGVGTGNSHNRSMSVGNNGYTLFLEPVGMTHCGQGRDEELTREGAAEYYWSPFIERLR